MSIQAANLPPCFLFAPDDEVAVGRYLLPRLLGWRLQIGSLILDDDPLSAPPAELLERNGRKEEAFFFAEGQARCGKGTRQKRTCEGGGWWEGQKTCAEGDKLSIPGAGGGGQEAAWRKKAFNFHGGGGGKGNKKGSTGWVMHEYAVTAPEDLARSPLRLYHIRHSSYGRKQSAAMEVPPALGLPPGFLFAPEDGDVVAHYLLPRILGQPLPLDGLIIDDDPLSATPWELLERNGCKQDAFFFALGQAKSSKGSRQKRTCTGGGFWNGERTCTDGEKLRLPGPGGEEVAWRKKALSFQEGGEKGSTGWVMHEYAITAPDHLADTQLRLYRIRFSGHGKKRKRGDADSSAGDAAPSAVRRRVAEDALLDLSTSQPICSFSSTPMGDQAEGNCIIDEDQLAAPATIPANQDATPCIADGKSWDLASRENVDFVELLRSLTAPSDPSVSPSVTDPGAYQYLDADGAGSSFFCQTAAPYNDQDQLSAAVTIPANQDPTPGITDGTSWENVDFGELLRSLTAPSEPSVLPSVTDPGAYQYLDADGAGSSFFGQTAAPYNGVGTGLASPSSLLRGCVEPADSSFFAMPNQPYAAY